MTSSNPPRRLVLAALLLGTAVTAASFSLILNKTQPPPNGTGLPVKWPAGTIRLRMMLGDTTNLSDGSSFNQSARTAAQSWNTVIGSAQFQTEFAGTGAPTDQTGSVPSLAPVNELGFAAKVFGKDFDSGTIAVTVGYSLGNERIESDITFNTAYSWNSYRGTRPATLPSGTIDLQRVALHELGHVLGLDHPDEAGQNVDAIMNSHVGSRYELSLDDIEGGQSIYGPPGAPANNNFGNATVLSLGGNPSVSVKGYNTNATKETGDPRQGGNPGGRSIWWRWGAPSNGSVTINTRGSYFDTTLGVYTGTSLASLSWITDNDDIDPGVVQASTVTFNATAGTEYLIMVDGYNNGENDPTDLNGADNAGLTLNLAFSGSLGTAPAITTQPAGQAVTAGGSASFSVVASGTAPLFYQWYLNNTAISGATSSTHTLTGASSSNAGSYHVVVTNQAGSVTSNPATLTVNAAPAPAPSGGGGGGAPNLWFVTALALLGLGRLFHSRNDA